MTFPMMLRVASLRAEARDVMTFELRGATGAALPAFEPGAHIEIEVPGDGAPGELLIRHYSICNSPAERNRYVVAVGLYAGSRGGSRSLHAGLRVGSLIRVRSLANNFTLVADAGRYRFVAGGIGITPIRSMIHWCEARGREWSLLYCVRSRVRAAFLEELQAFGNRVTFHFADEHEWRLADIDAALATDAPGEVVYCCGPASLMQAVASATAARAAGRVHFEWFAAGHTAASDAPSDATAFEIVLRRSGVTLQVEAHKSILETLEANGVAVPFACREGLCRTCETGLCAGEADHRDVVLSVAECSAQTSLMICVSRARSKVLELDL